MRNFYQNRERKKGEREGGKWMDVETVYEILGDIGQAEDSS